MQEVQRFNKVLKSLVLLGDLRGHHLIELAVMDVYFDLGKPVSI